MIRVGEGNEIYSFGQYAEEGKLPHFARRQTSEQQGYERQHPARDEHPPGGNIFIFRLFEDQIPGGVKQRADDEKNEGKDGHNGDECTIKGLIAGGRFVGKM